MRAQESIALCLFEMTPFCIGICHYFADFHALDRHHMSLYYDTAK
jgi:hypothetical protein